MFPSKENPPHSFATELARKFFDILDVILRKLGPGGCALNIGLMEFSPRVFNLTISSNMKAMNIPLKISST